MISIIIPTFNEADQISNTISKIKKRAEISGYEIIVIDGGSTDNTIELAKAAGVKAIVHTTKSRSSQMNKGAELSKYDILFFVHADSIPPPGFLKLIYKAVITKSLSGCFRLKFDLHHWFLNANSWFTKFNLDVVRFGDQGLFVTREIFEKIGGFDEDLMIMEDQEIIHRIKKHTAFKILDAEIITSARKYRDNGIYKTQFVFYLIWTMFYMGFSQQKLLKTYRKLTLRNKI